MGINSEQYGSLLIPIIMTKLPQDLRLRIARETDKEVWQIDELMTVIKKEVEAREATEFVKLHQPKPPVGSRSPFPSTPTAAALVTSGSSVRCVYCKESHYSASCLKFRTPQERRAILVRTGRCFNCLKNNHKCRECESPKTCRYCNRRHHQSICDRGNSNEPNPSRPGGTPSTSSSNTGTSSDSSGNTDHEATPTSANTTSVSKNHRTVLLQTAHTTAFASPNGPSVPVRVLFDNGSQLSYVTETLKRQLNLKSMKIEKLHLNTFGHNSFRTQECAVVSFYLQGLQQCEAIKLSALTSPSICSPLPSAVSVSNYPHLQDLLLADECDKPKKEVDVLIGSNFYWSFVTGDVVKSSEGPVAVDSKLGWLLSGPINSHETNDVSHACTVISGVPANPIFDDKNDTLVNLLREFWTVESLGILDHSAKASTASPFPPKVSFHNNRYSVSLPWKLDHPEIPNHLSLCESRLKGLFRKLQSSPEMLIEYDKIIRDQLEAGIIEIVKPDLTNQAVGTRTLSYNLPVHYLPHHGVVRQDSQTTKLRIVYDGSARALGDLYSLNDCLQMGPNYIPKLLNILMQFRWHRIAITADIEKAFLMVGVDPPDRDFLRFLWVKDPLKLPYEVIHFRFTRLVFGLRSSPAILGAVLLQHISQYCSKQPEIAEKLRDSFYVDDLITGASDVQTALNFCLQARKIMTAGGMNLRKWKSNSPELLQKIESAATTDQPTTLAPRNVKEEDKTCVKAIIGHNILQSSDHTSRILGVAWNSSRDAFSFDFAELREHLKTTVVTKRLILRLTAKIFDPLGLFSPFVIQLKVLFQDLCVCEAEWDSPLSGELLLKWKRITSELSCLEGVTVPRCYFKFSSPCQAIQIHGFCDASERAFAGVVYMRSVYKDGSVEVVLMVSKTRVAPTKPQTIPRLELLGALVLSRLVSNVITSLPTPVPTFYWTDSMAALHWIRVNKPWKQYISHRVSEIRRLTKCEQWQHCPGDINPADIPSRGASGDKLAASKIWWKGPEFLQLPENHWPSADVFPPSEITESEVVKSPGAITHVLVNTTDGKPDQARLDEIIECTKYSSLNKLLRVTGIVLKFKNSLQNCHQGEGMELPVQKNHLTGEDMDAAEVFWLRSIQAKSFATELLFLHSKCKHLPPVRVNQFSLFIDDLGLLRCQGRINNAQLSTATKRPILLPPNHPWVTLLIRQVHQNIKHSGTADTLSTIRERYWILKGRQTVKKILKSCVICNKVEGVPYSSVVPPDLPSFRTSDEPPFSHAGIDFAGPLYVKSDSQLDKAYVCLFTCSSTRAVHLELTPDLSVSSFLLLFCRFASRRGLPVTLISDNAKTFKTSSKEILKIARSNEVIRFLGERRVTWKFIVEKAPWWGVFGNALCKV